MSFKVTYRTTKVKLNWAFLKQNQRFCEQAQNTYPPVHKNRLIILAAFFSILTWVQFWSPTNKIWVVHTKPFVTGIWEGATLCVCLGGGGGLKMVAFITRNTVLWRYYLNNADTDQSIWGDSHNYFLKSILWPLIWTASWRQFRWGATICYYDDIIKKFP